MPSQRNKESQRSFCSPESKRLYGWMFTHTAIGCVNLIVQDGWFKLIVLLSLLMIAANLAGIIEIEERAHQKRLAERIKTATDKAFAIAAARNERRRDITLPGAQVLRQYVQFAGEPPSSVGYAPLVTLDLNDLSKVQAEIIDNYLDSAEDIVRIQRESNEALAEDLVTADTLLSSSALSVAGMLQHDVETRELVRGYQT